MKIFESVNSLISRLTVHVVFDAISTSPVTALIGSCAAKPPISKKARRPEMTEDYPSTRCQKGVAAVGGNGERCGIGYD